MERDQAIAVAARIVDVVVSRDLRMGLLTGSAARGLSDASSDLDVYLYWDRLDVEAVSDAHRFDPIGARIAFGVPTASGWFSKLELDGTYVDVESLDTSVLATAQAVLTAGAAPPGWAVKLAAGLRDAIAVHGPEQLTAWQQRLTYGDETAVSDARIRMARLLSPTALLELTYARGDALSFASRIAQLLLDVVAVLGAINRRFIPVDEPKWIPWHLAQLTDQPHHAAERIHTALTLPCADTMEDLDALVGETLDLVDTHLPDAETRSARYALGLRPRPVRHHD